MGPDGWVVPFAGTAPPPSAHCLIRGAGGQFTIRAADSGDGLLVNGVAVRSHQLQHGDEVRLGDCLWRFLVDEVPASAWQVRGTVQFNESLCQGCGTCVTVCPAGSLRLAPPAEIEHDMVGEGASMRRVYQFIAKLAPTDSTVLITGESGTGKELAAQAIHRNSRRAGKPFVAINCAALTPTLLESELFGHEKGAFTGALVQKRGKLEVADGGTVFLDEIGEFDLALQSKLLRVLQERECERVGATRPIKVDFRLLAATNQDLEEAVEAGRFRRDLFYRLNVVSIRLPALRERREDIPLLADCFIARHSRRCGRRVLGLSPEARDCLLTYDWPGNVRELENAIERAVVLGATEHILPEDLPETLLESAPVPPAAPARYHAAVREAKRQLIASAFEQAGGSCKEAAELLGLHPNYLHRLVRNLNLRPVLRKAAP